MASITNTSSQYTHMNRFQANPHVGNRFRRSDRSIYIPYRNPADLRGEIAPKFAKLIKDLPHFATGASYTDLETQVEKCFEIYANAYHGHFDVVLLCNTAQRSDRDVIYNFGTISSEPGFHDMTGMERAFSSCVAGGRAFRCTDLEDVTRSFDRHMRRGALINERHWWPLMNDMAILGAIHKRKEFHLAYDGPPPDGDIWDTRENRPRVLGRELIMCLGSGYNVKVDPRTRGIILLPDSSLPLPSYHELHKLIKRAGLEDIQRFLGSARPSSPPVPPSSPYDSMSMSSRSGSPVDRSCSTTPSTADPMSIYSASSAGRSSPSDTHRMEDESKT